MSDIMRPIPFARLMTWMLAEYKREGKIFGVTPYYGNSKTHTDRNPDEGSVRPRGCDSTISEPRGVHRPKETFSDAKHPAVFFGPAAGPHTQLAQNIIAAYVAGARFFELKTVQIMDGEELSACVNKPCIIAYDESYNCEWSTELTVPQAFNEYVKAWFACKLLAVELSLGAPDAFVFNMSVGYDLKGIQSEKIDRYLEGMKDASATAVWKECRDWTLANLSRFAQIDEAYVNNISPVVSRSVTESTLHGCPPDEIERIATYLLTEKGLHTYVKCNPTLLGYDFARKRLDSLGYDYIVFDDHHFKEDLQWEDAVPMLTRLLALGREKGLSFGVKLTNTFPVDVTRGELPSEEMYMSGRSLYVLTAELAKRLAEAFDGRLPISWSGGADAANILPLIRAGIQPVTMATTLLKPGGYDRLSQIAELFADEPQAPGQIDPAAVAALSDTAETDPYYRKPVKPLPSRKLDRKVPLLDCFTAPCADGCPIHQDIPAYLAAVDAEDYAKALQIILERNPLPFITGTICPHTCGNKCMRNYYESAVDIRGAKLLAAENAFGAVAGELKIVNRLPRRPMVPLRSGCANHSAEPVVSAPWRNNRAAESMRPPGASDSSSDVSPDGTAFTEKNETAEAFEYSDPRNDRNVAIIGGGPAGLSVAAFLNRAGIPVTIFERTDSLGGVVRHVIPNFRISAEAIDNDIALCLPPICGNDSANDTDPTADTKTLFHIELEHEITDPKTLLDDGFTDVVIAVGAWSHGDAHLEYGEAVNALTFLQQVKSYNNDSDKDNPSARNDQCIESGAPGDCMISAERLVRHGAETTGSAECLAKSERSGNINPPGSRLTASLDHLLGQASRTPLRDDVRACNAGQESVPAIATGDFDCRNRAANYCVAVVGGGNTAMDCARAAMRIPGVEEVSLVYRRDAHNMPADEEELQMALADGVTFRPLLAPVGVKDGFLDCKVMRLGAPDESGRQAPEDTGERTQVKADLVIAAVGEQIDPALYKAAGCALDGKNRPALDENLQTSVAHIYAAGDCKAGPATVVKAIADAAKVAHAISGITFDHYAADNIAAEAAALRARHGSCCTSCLGCATVCEACAEVCPNRANIAVRVPGMAKTQIVHIDGMCNECGNCAVFCPYASRPYRDKFTLFWSREDFDASENEGFLPLTEDTALLRLDGNTREISLSDEKDLPQGLPQLMQTLRKDYAYLISD